MKQDTYYASIHVVTESADHCTYLIEFENKQDIIEQLKTNLYEDFSTVCDVDVEQNHPDLENRDLELSIMAAVYEAH